MNYFYFLLQLEVLAGSSIINLSGDCKKLYIYLERKQIMQLLLILQNAPAIFSLLCGKYTKSLLNIVTTQKTIKVMHHLVDLEDSTPKNGIHVAVAPTTLSGAPPQLSAISKHKYSRYNTSLISYHVQYPPIDSWVVVTTIIGNINRTSDVWSHSL